jgi:hypothetical protein
VLPVLAITSPGTSDLAIGLDASLSEGSSLFFFNPFILSHFQYQSAARKHRLELRVASTGQKEVIGHSVLSGVLV